MQGDLSASGLEERPKGRTRAVDAPSPPQKKPFAQYAFIVRSSYSATNSSFWFVSVTCQRTSP